MTQDASRTNNVEDGRHFVAPRPPGPRRKNTSGFTVSTVGGQTASPPAERGYIREALDRLQKGFTALGAIFIIVVLAGPSYCYQRLGLTIDDLGLTPQIVATRTVGFVAVAIVFCGACLGMCVLMMTNHRLRLRFRSAIRDEDSERIIDLASTTVGLELFTFLCAAFVGWYESSTLMLALSDWGPGPAVFVVAYFAAMFAGCAALGCALVHIAVPRTIRPWLTLLMRASKMFNRSRANSIIASVIAVLAGSTFASMALSAAVSVQIRHGREPGQLGELIGIQAQCSRLLTPDKEDPHGAVLRIGESEGHTIVIVRGETYWLKAGAAMQELPAEACEFDVKR